MLLSLKWLREFVPVEAGAQEVGDRLTMLGLEQEDIIHPYDAIKDIVVGHVLTKEAHPDSDHLAVCTVDVGQEEVLNNRVWRAQCGCRAESPRGAGRRDNARRYGHQEGQAARRAFVRHDLFRARAGAFRRS